MVVSRGTLLTSILLLACSPASGEAVAPDPTLPPPGVTAPAPAARVVDLQGHRGARGLHPENTREGFAAALAIGVTTLEMDLGVTRDGVVVVHHDERLNPDLARGGDGRWLEPPTPAIVELTFPELQQLDVGRLRPGSAYAARFGAQQGRDRVRIPRLVDVLALAETQSRKSIRYNLETKLTPTAPDQTLAPEPFAEQVLAVLRAAGVARRATVQSFDWRTLRHLKRIAPEVETVCLSHQSPTDDTIGVGAAGPSPWTAGLDVDDHGGSTPRLVQAAGCSTWSPALGDLDEAALAEAHGVGLRVVVWTVNEPRDIEAMLTLGVDGIISDYPDRVRAALEARGWPLPTRHPAVPPACELRLAEGADAAQRRPGPAYVVGAAGHATLTRIDAGGTTLAGLRITSLPSLATGPQGELWIGEAASLRVLDTTARAPRRVGQVAAGMELEELAVDTTGGAWIVRSEPQWRAWELLRHDGRAWTQVREGKQFTGERRVPVVDDLAVTTAGVWVATWNGLWRGDSGSWQRVAPPPRERSPNRLFTSRDRLVAVFGGGIYVREKSSWRHIRHWPAEGSVRTVSAAGLIVGGELFDKNTLWLSSLAGDCVLKSDVLSGRRLWSAAADESGRIWLATDHGLVVLDRQGQVIAEWAPGMLDGLDGAASRVAVAFGGPQRLPAPRPPRRLVIAGRLVLHQSTAPLGGATIELSAGNLFVRRAVSGDDGSFQLDDVPEGFYLVTVAPPAGHPFCSAAPTRSGFKLVTAAQCAPVGMVGNRCTLGDLPQCWPAPPPGP